MTLADGGSPGGLGFLIFVVFIVVAIVLFLAMSRSMRRMRSNVDRGNFGTPPAEGRDEDQGKTPPAA